MIEVALLSIIFEITTKLNLGASSLQSEFAVTVESLESLLIGVFSIVLLLLSISSYKKTGVKSIKYAASAFGLFAFDVFVELIMEKYYYSNYPLLDLFHTTITLAILGLFFLSIIKRT